MAFIQGARRFVIFTQPHAADPHWATATYEMVDDPEDKRPADPIEYTDYNELLKIVLEAAFRRARAEGYNQAALDIMKLFGHTIDEYREKIAARKTAKPPEAK